MSTKQGFSVEGSTNYPIYERQNGLPVYRPFKELKAISEEIGQSFDDLKRAARKGMLEAQAEPATVETAAPSPDNDEPSSSETSGAETPIEGTDKEPEVETSPSQGGEADKDYWDQYKDEAERRKALNETKRYAAEVAKELKELKGKSSQPTPEVKEEVKVETKTESDEVPDVDSFIDQAINLKAGHTEDQLRIAQVNYEVLKFKTNVLEPTKEAAQTAKANLEKATEAIRDQKAIVAHQQKKADGNSLYADDLKEAQAELRDLQKAHTDARLDWNEAAGKLEKAESEFAKKSRDGRALAQELVVGQMRKSRESKAQLEREASEKKTREESNKAWTAEFKKALKSNGLDGVSEKHERLLHDSAYNHILRLSQSGKVKEDADLQVLIKEAFEPYLELKSSAPVLEDKVERKKSLTDEPGPETRKAKTGEEKPKTLAEWRQAAKRGMKAAR